MRKIREFSAIINNLREYIGNIPLVDLMDKVFTETGYADSLMAENTPEARGRMKIFRSLSRRLWSMRKKTLKTQRPADFWTIFRLCRTLTTTTLSRTLSF
ncbi:MAG: hypothetical protein L6V93_09070 [Clostridiales bacterium]|nr:MAG: hypothetical protein L6V93_09070 [Clostridiales bacterium]